MPFRVYVEDARGRTLPFPLFSRVCPRSLVGRSKKASTPLRLLTSNEMSGQDDSAKKGRCACADRMARPRQQPAAARLRPRRAESIKDDPILSKTPPTAAKKSGAKPEYVGLQMVRRSNEISGTGPPLVPPPHSTAESEGSEIRGLGSPSNSRRHMHRLRQIVRPIQPLPNSSRLSVPAAKAGQHTDRLR